MQTSKHGFELDDAGNVKVALLTGFAMAPVAGISCVVKIDYARTPQDISLNRSDSLQLNLSPEQLRKLGEALLRKADEVEASIGTATQ